MTGFVIDASVALKWFVPEELSDEAEALAGVGARLIAPRLIFTELANAFWKKVRADLVQIDQAAADLKSAARYFNEIADHEDLLPEALASACLLRHPVYDLIYLELARKRGFTMVTADSRLIAILRNSPLAGTAVHLSTWRAS